MCPYELYQTKNSMIISCFESSICVINYYWSGLNIGYYMSEAYFVIAPDYLSLSAKNLIKLVLFEWTEFGYKYKFWPGTKWLLKNNEAYNKIDKV